MLLRLCTLLAVMSVFILLLAGCHGDDAALNPVIQFKFPPGTILPRIDDKSSLVISDDSSVVVAEDDAVISHAWTQNPANAGTFTSTATLATTWVSRDLTGQPTPRYVTLYLTTRTKLGGESVTPITLEIYHSELPAITFAAATPAQATVGTPVNIDATVALDPGDQLRTIAWTQAPANAGVFGSPGTVDTAWTALGPVGTNAQLTLTVTTASGKTTTQTLTMQMQ